MEGTFCCTQVKGKYKFLFDLSCTYISRSMLTDIKSGCIDLSLQPAKKGAAPLKHRRSADSNSGTGLYLVV
jgi:hypothetical protein